MRSADTIIESNAIFNGVSDKLINGFVAIKDDHIQYVGEKEFLDLYKGSNTKVIQAQDKLVMPGFNDAHVHMYMSALYASPLVNVSFEDKSAAECVAGLKKMEDRIPKDEWLIGAGWYYTLWDDPTMPTKADIDAVYPDRPVAMVSADCHTFWVNTKGLEKLGITKDSVAPEGGSYNKDEDGELTGIIEDTAASALQPKIYDFDNETVEEFYNSYMAEMNKLGITSICDVSMMAIPGLDFIRDDVYEKMQKDNKVSVRVNMFPTLRKDLNRPLELRDKFQGNMVRCQGVKQFFDGVSSTHTAYLKDDYSDAWFKGDHGHPSMPVEKMEELVLWAYKNDLSPRVHAIGDQSIHNLINFFEEAQEKYGDKPYLHPTIEHLENFQKEDIARLGKLRVIPSVQPPHLMVDPNGIEKDLGQERIQYMWPFRMMLDAGSTLAFGTDSPVVEINPFYGIYNAVTRQSAFTKEPKGGWIHKERISLFEALRAYTYGSACAASRESEYGTLAPNKLADLVILDKNLFKEDNDAILDTKVDLTMLGGKIVYKK